MVPLKICSSPEDPQLVHQTISPVAGEAMAVFCALVMRGGKNPLVTELTSKMAQLFGAAPLELIATPMFCENTLAASAKTTQMTAKIFLVFICFYLETMMY
jgi:hypothetical protein